MNEIRIHPDDIEAIAEAVARKMQGEQKPIEYKIKGEAVDTTLLINNPDLQDDKSEFSKAWKEANNGV